MNTNWAKFESVVAEAVNSSPPAAGIECLVNGLKLLISADAAVLYLLHLDKSHFIPRYGDPTAIQDAPPDIDVEVANGNGRRSFAGSAIQQLKVLSRSIAVDQKPLVQVAIPVLRGKSSIGVLLLQRSSERPLSEEEKSLANLTSDTIISLVEKQSSFQLLQAVQKPINFHQSLNDYLDELLLQVAVASGMPMIIIRELHPEIEALQCIASFGLNIDKSELDLMPISNFAPFKQATDSRQPVSFPDADAVQGNMRELLSRQGLNGVLSFVVAPILVGDAAPVFGTLSFAASVRYNYSALEIAGFETIANLIGTSITNYRNAQTVNELHQTEGELGIGLTALEVAQAARHEARNEIDAILIELAILKSQSGSTKDTPKLHYTIGKITDRTHEISRALDKIQAVSKAPKRELLSASLKQIIQDASALVTGKIAKERVYVRPTEGKDINIEVYPERLRHAFLNLFLNSLDAFSERKKQSGREIRIMIDPGSLDADELKIRFSDNAIGIDPTSLKGAPSQDLAIPVQEVIFRPGVTSKENGSGHGLFLVRRIIDEHRGSIDLVDYRGGVTFEIKLPKDLRKKQEKEQLKHAGNTTGNG